MISTIVKIPTETTKRIKVFELLNSFSVLLVFLPFLISSQTPNPNMRHMQTSPSYNSNNLNLLCASPMHPT